LPLPAPCESGRNNLDETTRTDTNGKELLSKGSHSAGR
jgi:hypothetical protein